jgi:hypothetical protein
MNLKPFVNDKHLYDDFLQELDERIESARRSLEQASTQEEMFRCQGDIRTLRKLKLLRDKVNG